MIELVEVERYKCDKCQKTWYPKKMDNSVGLPSVCAFCKSKKWNESQQEASVNPLEVETRDNPNWKVLPSDEPFEELVVEKDFDSGA